MKIIRKRSNVFSNTHNRKHFIVTANQHIIYCDTDDSYEEYQGEHDQYEDVWDSIKEIDQEFTSENTSINSTKLPAIFNMISFEPGTVNVDYGGGKFDNVADYLTQYDVINMVLDPFNRSKAHNREVINLIREHGGADTATCSNVLNVIKEPQNRIGVLENMKKLVRPSGKVYITVYEGSGKGNEGETKSGYQLNKKTAEYMDEILQVFPNATRKGKLITAINDSSTSSVAASYYGVQYGTYTYTMDIDFRGDVNVTENGIDIYSDTFSFNPEPYRNDYFKDEDTGAKIISVDDILQNIDDILNGDDILNANIGAHTISGVINIVAEIDGVDYTEDFRGRDEDGDPTYDREFFTDDSDSIIKSFDIEIVSVN